MIVRAAACAIRIILLFSIILHNRRARDNTRLCRRNCIFRQNTGCTEFCRCSARLFRVTPRAETGRLFIISSDWLPLARQCTLDPQQRVVYRIIIIYRPIVRIRFGPRTCSKPGRRENASSRKLSGGTERAVCSSREGEGVGKTPAVRLTSSEYYYDSRCPSAHGL